MSIRPNWTKAIQTFISDTIFDDKYDFPEDGSDDAIHDRIEAAVNNILCETYGHEIIDDQCGIPAYRYCMYCNALESNL